MNTETKIYRISGRFARANDLPTSFAAIEVAHTTRAIKVYGHGEMDPSGRCCRCGRKLTHPGSILLGIGPECLGDWGARDIVLDKVTPEQLSYIKSLIREVRIDGWIPRSVIKDEYDTEEVITPPVTHTEQRQATNGAVSNTNVVQQKQTVTVQEEVKKACEWKGSIAVKFPYDPETVQQVRQLERRQYHPDGKYWTCPITIPNIQKLLDWEFRIDEKLQQIYDKAQITVESVSDDIEIPGLKMNLFPYQKQGVQFLEQKSGRAIIGDEMGLGKTAQTLAWLQLHPKRRPAVIVTPASLKLNWKREIAMWMSLKDAHVHILSGKKPYSLFSPVQDYIYIINYDVLPYWVEELKKVNPKVVITDECHYYKNTNAKRTKAVKALAKSVPHFIALSGTPIVNRPIEAYNAINIVDGGLMPSFWKFAQRYCGAKHNGYGWDFSGASNTKELHEKLKSIMIRRKKSEVLKDLPDKLRSFIPIELSNQKEYDKAESNFISYLKQSKGQAAAEKAKGAEHLTQIEALKQLAVKGKLEEVINWIEDGLETNGKMVVFATHKATIDALMEEFKGKAVKVDGSVSAEDRDKAVQAFQNNDSVRLFVGNIKAAGVGLTLTAASTVVFLELPWTPGELSQAEDRCHRIGQKNCVNVYYLLAENTIEERIAALLDDKRKVLDAVLDGTVTEESSLLTELINQYTK